MIYAIRKPLSFRLGRTETGLYSQRRLPEAGNFGIMK